MSENSNVGTEQLKNYDITVAIDRSGSMLAKDQNGGKSRWEAAQEATFAIASKAEQYDADGISIVVFGGNTIKHYENVTGAGNLVNTIFAENEPASGTPTAKMLEECINRYFEAKAGGANPKPILLAVVTDGQPDDKDAVAKVIVEATKKMESDEEIGITFLQIGNDPDAKSFLEKLDDDLTSQGAKFDIVDTKNLNDVENITEALLAALND